MYSLLLLELVELVELSSMTEGNWGKGMTTVLTYQRKSVWGPELLVIQLEDLLQPRLRLAAHKLSMIGKANEQKTSDTLSNLILKMYSFET